MSLTSAAADSGAAAATATEEIPSWHKIVGISLAVSSALFIGASYVLKKRGLLDANATDGKKPGDGYSYLKKPLWWVGLFLMLFGEICNTAAYAFSPAVIVTPMGAGSVVISAVLSQIFLGERLDFSAKIGCLQCVLGAILLALNGPSTNATTTLASFWEFAIAPVFLGYAGLNVLVLLFLMVYAVRKWGDKHPIVHISICSLIGAFVVTAAQGLGAAIVYTASTPNDNQFKQWSMYPLIAFVLLSGVLQINYLNKALNIFSTAVVTPIYYVCFTTSTLICSTVLFRSLQFPSTIAAVSCGIAFMVIVGGVSLLFAYNLQMAKVEMAAAATANEKSSRGPIDAPASRIATRPSVYPGPPAETSFSYQGYHYQRHSTDPDYVPPGLSNSPPSGRSNFPPSFPTLASATSAAATVGTARPRTIKRNGSSSAMNLLDEAASMGNRTPTPTEAAGFGRGVGGGGNNGSGNEYRQQQQQPNMQYQQQSQSQYHPRQRQNSSPQVPSSYDLGYRQGTSNQGTPQFDARTHMQQQQRYQQGVGGQQDLGYRQQLPPQQQFDQFDSYRQQQQQQQQVQRQGRSQQQQLDGYSRQ